MRNKIIFVSCVRKKESDTLPASDLYISTWFNKASAYAKQIGDRWYILSAKYGLLSPSNIIEPYNKSLNVMPATERKEWAKKVLIQIKEITSPNDELIFLAGTRYREYLIEPLQKTGYIISIPMKGLGIGKQLKWLNERI